MIDSESKVKTFYLWFTNKVPQQNNLLIGHDSWFGLHIRHQSLAKEEESRQVRASPDPSSRVSREHLTLTGSVDS